MMRVLVCGGRDYLGYGRLRDALDRVRQYQATITCIIQGGAKGADFLGKVYAHQFNIPCEEYPADWKQNGRAAGPIRNQRMLDEGKPDLVIAFPGGRGTADMVRRAEAAGVKVFRVTDDA